MVLTLGVTCQIGQVVYLRELLMVFHGNELALGIILAAWMIWVAIGSRLGAAVLRRNDDVLRLLRLNAVLVALLLPVTVLLIRLLPGLFDVPPGALLSLSDMALASLAVMAPSTVLLGAQFVLLARLWRDSHNAVDASGAARTYVGEAAGNVAGGLLFTLFLVHHLNSFQAIVLVAALLLISVLYVSHRRWCLVPAVASLAVLPFLPQVDWWSSQLQWRLMARDYRLLETYQSRYGTISVLQHHDQHSFFQSGHLIFSTGGDSELGVGLEEQEAVTLAHLSMSQHRDPQRVLLIGGGLRGTLREIVRYPVQRIDYVELDEILIGAALPHLAAGTRDALADSRVRLIHSDGRLYIKTTTTLYDLIIVDVPDPTTAVLNRFYTEEFFSEAAARLEPDGILVVGAVSTPDLRGSAIANRNATIYHTLRRVFPDVLPMGERFLFYFAAKRSGQISADVMTLMRRFFDRGVEAPGFSAGHFAVLLDPGPLQRINWVLRNHGRTRGAHLEPPPGSPLLPGTIEEIRRLEEDLPAVQERFFVNSDFRPIGYYHTLVFWNVLARGDQATALRWIARVQRWWIAPPLLVILAVAVLLRGVRGGNRRAGTRFALLCAVFTTGLSTMAMQIALLFAFQSIYGFVYEMVGLIVAVFMAGLALGAWLTQSFVPDRSDRRVLAAVQGAVALFAAGTGIALPWAAGLSSAAAVFVIFCVITFFAGVLNGADFPLAAACYLALDGRPERSTAAVYGVELLGACCGAAVASAVIAPVFGIVACCLLATFGNGTAFVVLGISGVRTGREYA
ncbi:MAG: spermine synthase [Spirochaetaceae bacterium]|nr:MAG: spermine synthase [Spirochaetaceae bacterium]